MRILFFFCDMLRPDKVEKGAVYDIFRRLGGTWYTNAYTPTPETPRAMAAFYTGLYPAKNGCIKRGMWPYYFQNPDLENIFSLLAKQGYKSYYYASPYSFSPKEGIVPRGFDQYAELVFDYKTLVEKTIADKSDNLCVYAGFDDYHDAVDIYSCGSVVSRDEADGVGQAHLKACMEQLLDAAGSSFFDKIIIFSDHGCMLKSDGIKNGDKLAYVSPIRTGITLFVHDKGAAQVTREPLMVSLLDIFPTVAGWTGQHAECDGISLDSDAKRHLVVEDIYHYRGVDRFIYSTYNLWAFIGDEFYYIETIEGDQRLYKCIDSVWNQVPIGQYVAEVEAFRQEIASKSCFYSRNTQGYKLIAEKEKAVGNELLFRTDAQFGSKYSSAGRRIRYTDGGGFDKTPAMRIRRKLADIGYQWQHLAGVMKSELKELFKLF